MKRLDHMTDRSTVPEGRYLHEAAGDDDGGEEPTKIQSGISHHFIGTQIRDASLPIEEDGTLYVEGGDLVWL